MACVRSGMLLLLLIMSGVVTVHAQSTSVVLPTNDDTSAFEVKQENGTVVLEAKADGNVTVSGTIGAQDIEATGDITVTGTVDAQTLSASGNATVGGSVNATSFHGDGSTLSNVRPIATYAGGGLVFELTYAEQVVKYVQLAVPCAGIIIVNASGNGVFKSVDEEAYRLCITPETWIDYDYLLADSQEANSDVTDQYKPFALTRGFTINSAGTYRYNLIGDLVYGDVELRDVNMTAMFFPTAGAGAGKVVPLEETPVNVGDVPAGRIDFP